MTLATLAARNLLRNRFRTVLTILAVAIAVLAFIVLRTLIDAWGNSTTLRAKDRLFTMPVHFVPIPLRAGEAIRAVPHVTETTVALWFGGRDPARPHDFFPVYAIDGDSYLRVFSEIITPSDQLQSWREDQQGALVGDVIAHKMGWKIGDRVRLVSDLFPKPVWEFKVDGIYRVRSKTLDRTAFYFHYDYLNRSLPPDEQDQAQGFISRVDDPAYLTQVATVIDARFADGDTPTLSVDESGYWSFFLGGISAVIHAVDVISFVILLILVMVLGNTIAMGVRERTNEYGVLKAIGFSRRHVLALVLGEAVLIGALGAALGIGAAYPFVHDVFGRFLEENMSSFFPDVRIEPCLTAIAAMSAVTLGLLAAALPAARASRLGAVEALRSVQ